MVLLRDFPSLELFYYFGVVVTSMYSTSPYQLFCIHFWFVFSTLKIRSFPIYFIFYWFLFSIRPLLQHFAEFQLILFREHGTYFTNSIGMVSEPKICCELILRLFYGHYNISCITYWDCMESWHRRDSSHTSLLQKLVEVGEHKVQFPFPTRPPYF